ncbi:hypothetical protein HN748_01005 [Candidatus Peregrinibacteria bacterium]|jgi:hypothetical protein|nr:hypothetical protein [Candidatus Peregrinibacteria bacterium]MBT7483483.1 hypothetical protein [Candidatus Peregrinibacteria bacterium]MBT7702790.1 hypothetical protein [Candidatus Peregrinibacteria bacterium]
MKNKTLKFAKQLVLFLVGTGVLLALFQSVALAGYEDVLTTIGDKIELENYDVNVHADASTHDGAKNITSAVFFVIDFVKYIAGTIAVLMLIINALHLLAAGKDSEEKTTKEKLFLKYALMGLVLIFVADEAIMLAFFGEEGEILRNEEQAIEFAEQGANLIQGIYTFIEVFLGSVAVLMMVISGFQVLVAAGSDESVTAAKKRIVISSIGLVIVGLAEVVIKDVIFKNQGEEVDVERGREVIVGLTNFLSSMIAVIAVLALVYAGFLYILNFGNDETTGKAKKIMFGAIIGMVLAAAAFAIVSTVIPVEGAS